VVIPGLPTFVGGLAGYIGYDTVRHFEKLPDYEHEGLDLPDVFLMLADTLVVFDNLTHRIKVIANAYIENGLKAAYEKACAKIDGIVRKLESKAVVPRTAPASRKRKASKSPAFSSNFTKKDFMNAVKKTKKYIKAGDVIQTVISQNFHKETDIAPINAYRALRVINPSPYMFYLETGKCTLVGSSPEILVKVEGDTVSLRPIAGTRRRGHTPEEDLFFEEELKADPKEIAEHIMLVDLGRNDAGRVAETGSVEVKELMTVEKYSHVMHLVSSVEGRLNSKYDAFDVLRASFPAGTVSGAPKIRAMEIIEELEPTKRGPYAGCVGYFDFSGNMDMCITIRTILFKDKKAYIQAGAGIVADSDPELEYKETLNKARGMFKAIEMAENELS
jgi:anthranilate synthase component 1